MGSKVQLSTTASLPTSNYRMISTRTIDNIDSAVKTAALYTAYTSNPTSALAGAAVGLIVRNISAGVPRHAKPEQHERAQLIASMCLTICAAAYVGYTPGMHDVVPFLLGISGSADGVYPLLYRAMN